MEKRSISEKILPKASLRKFNGLPFMVPLPTEAKQLNPLKENNYPDVSKLKQENGYSEAKVSLPSLSTKNGREEHTQSKPLLKKTTSVFQLNNPNQMTAQKPLINHPFLHIAPYQRGSTNERSPRSDKFKERLTHFKYQQSKVSEPDEPVKQAENKENTPNNMPIFSTASKQNLIQNGLRASFKFNPKEKSKTKRNIISFDPIMRKEMIKRETTKAQPTATKLSEHIPKEEYMELFIENLILKEKCKDNENIRKILFENILNSKATESAYKQPPQSQPMSDFGFNKENIQDPWFLLTQGAKINEGINKQERVFQTPDPKNNCCVNYINNNYHVNFVSPIKRDSRKIDTHKTSKRPDENVWRDKLMEFMQYNQNQNAFKKRNTEENISQESSHIKNNVHRQGNENHQTVNFNHQLHDNKPFKIKTSNMKQKSPNKPLKPTKLKIPINFLEDSTTHRENESTDKDESGSLTPLLKPCGADGKCDTLNFTFSNFKDQAK